VPGGDVLGIGDNGLSATPNCGPGSSTLAPTADTAPPSAASPLLATPDRRLRKGGRRGPGRRRGPDQPTRRVLRGLLRRLSTTDGVQQSGGTDQCRDQGGEHVQ
jgi:hypothetical protein